MSTGNYIDIVKKINERLFDETEGNCTTEEFLKVAAMIDYAARDLYNLSKEDDISKEYLINAANALSTTVDKQLFHYMSCINNNDIEKQRRIIISNTQLELEQINKKLERGNKLYFRLVTIIFILALSSIFAYCWLNRICRSTIYYISHCIGWKLFLYVYIYKHKGISM